MNVAAAFTRGAEVGLQVSLLRKSLTADLGYALTDSLDRERDRTLEGRALHRGTLSLRYRLRDLGMSASAWTAVTSERPFYDVVRNEEVEITADPFVSLDLRIDKTLGKHFTLFAGADNLFDAGDAEVLPVAPRTFYFGVTARYAKDEL